MFALTAALCLAAEPSRAAEPATPQRPTFSSSPATTANRTLELESGYFGSDADTADLPLTLKWGSGEQTELFLGWSPWTKAAKDVDGPGDYSVGVRHRFLEADDGPLDLAYQLSGKIPTATDDDGLGSGVPDVTTALTSAWAAGSWSVVGYYQLGLLGQSSGSGALVDHGLAFALGRPFGDKLSAFVEWSGTWRPELRSSDRQWIGGAAYALRPSLVLDAALSWVLQPGEDVLAVSAGITMNLGRPFDVFRSDG